MHRSERRALNSKQSLPHNFDKIQDREPGRGRPPNPNFCRSRLWYRLCYHHQHYNGQDSLVATRLGLSVAGLSVAFVRLLLRLSPRRHRDSLLHTRLSSSLVA